MRKALNRPQGKALASGKDQSKCSHKGPQRFILMNSMQTVYVTMANSISIAMHNAVTAQRQGQITANASTAVCCTMIIRKGNGQ